MSDMQTVRTTDPIADNPEFFRYLRSSLRPVKAIGISAAYVLILTSIALVLLFASWGFDGITMLEFRRAMRIYCAILLCIEYVVFLGGGALLISVLVAQEKERNTYDLHYLTTFSRKWCIAGKLLGGAIVPYLLVQLTLPFVVIAALAGSVPALPLVRTHVVLLTSGLFLHIYALTVSTFSKKTSSAQGITFGACVIYGFISFVCIQEPRLAIVAVMNPALHLIRDIAAIFGEKPEGGISQSINFFGIGFQPLPMTLLLYAYFGWWLLLAVVRRFEYALKPVYSRKQVFLFVLSFQLLLVGGLSPTTSSDASLATFVFFLINLVLLPAVSLILIPEYHQTLARFEGRKPGSFWSDHVEPKGFFLMLFGLAVCVHLVVQGSQARLSSEWIGNFALRAFCLVVYGWFYFGVIRFCRLFPLNNAGSIALGIIVLSLILPFPAAGALGWENSLHYAFILNPIGLSTRLFGVGDHLNFRSVGVLLNWGTPLLAIIFIEVLNLRRTRALKARIGR